MRAIERRAAQPWWQRSFGRWPWAARLGFGLVGIALAALTIPSASHALAHLGTFHAFARPWLEEARALSDAMRALTASLTRFVPSQWLYAGLAASAVLYAALFGLAIAAYRLLYVHSEPREEVSS